MSRQNLDIGAVRKFLYQLVIFPNFTRHLYCTPFFSNAERGILLMVILITATILSMKLYSKLARPIGILALGLVLIGGSFFITQPAQAADLACTIELPNGDILTGEWSSETGQCETSSSMTISSDSMVYVKPAGFFDRIKLWFTFDAEKKSNMFHDFSNRSFALAKTELLIGNTARANMFLEKSEKDNEKARASAAQIKDAEKKESAENSLDASASNRIQVLTAVQAKLENTTAKAAVGDALIRASADVKTDVNVKASENKGASASGNVSTNLGTVISGGPIAKCLSTSAPSITVLSPNGGETYTAGQQITVKWKSCNVNHPVGVTLSGYPYPNDTEFFLGNWSVMASAGSSVVTIPSNAQAGKYIINVSTPPESQQGASDWSDNFFKINNSLSQSCLHINNIQAGSTASFPLTITGTIEYGCWRIFEGEAGFVQVKQGGQFLSTASINSGLIDVTSDYYLQADYPVTFTATIPAITGGIAGSAELIFIERGDLGENPNSYTPSVESINIQI